MCDSRCDTSCLVDYRLHLRPTQSNNPKYTKIVQLFKIDDKSMYLLTATDLANRRQNFSILLSHIVFEMCNVYVLLWDICNNKCTTEKRQYLVLRLTQRFWAQKTPLRAADTATSESNRDEYIFLYL